MTVQYKAAFDKLEWTSPVQGVRHKCFDQNNVRLRLVEYSQDMPLHWCHKGHYGYLLEGELAIEYEKARVIYKAGDGIFIPDGPEHKHQGKALTDRAVAFFVETSS